MRIAKIRGREYLQQIPPPPHARAGNHFRLTVIEIGLISIIPRANTFPRVNKFRSYLQLYLVDFFARKLKFAVK
jgi:hypothetical protein